MNKEYYINRRNNIIVKDESNILHIREAYNNIDEILKQENLIEEFENGKKEEMINLALLNLDMVSVKDLIKTMIAMAIIIFPSSFIILGGIVNIFLSTPFVLSEVLKISAIIIAVLEGPLAASYGIFIFPKYLKAKKELPKVEENLELLKEKLEKEEQNLIELKKSATKNYTNQTIDKNKTIKLETYDYKQLLKEAKKELSNEDSCEKGRQLVKK